MGWTSGSNSNIIGWSGSGGKPGANSHGWVNEHTTPKPLTAAEIAAEAAKAEGIVIAVVEVLIQ